MEKTSKYVFRHFKAWSFISSVDYLGRSVFVYISPAPWAWPLKTTPLIGIAHCVHSVYRWLTREHASSKVCGVESVLFILQISLLAMLSPCLRSLFKNQRHRTSEGTASDAIWSEEPKLGSSPRSPRRWPLWSTEECFIVFLFYSEFFSYIKLKILYLTSTYLSYPLEPTQEMHRLVSGRQFWCLLQTESPIPSILLHCPNTESEL